MTANNQPDILGATPTNEALLLMTKTLERYRLERTMNQLEFADLLGVTHATYSRIIKGKRQAQPTTKRKIAAALGVQVNDIAEFELEPEDD